MKLTLRFLLAYMDDILRPNDAREVGKALAQNKPASDLVQRIRGVIRMRRLSAPTPLSEAPGQNANDVADYLDNMMSPDDIRGFEQRCLESDEQLAEVGACHQILSHVIGRGVTMPHSTQLKLLQVASSIPVQPASGASRQADSVSGSGTEAKSFHSASTPLHADLVPPLELRKSSASWQKRTAVLGVMLLAGIWFYSIVTDPSLRYDQEIAGRPADSTSALKGHLLEICWETLVPGNRFRLPIQQEEKHPAGWILPTHPRLQPHHSQQSDRLRKHWKWWSSSLKERFPRSIWLIIRLLHWSWLRFPESPEQVKFVLLG